MELQNAKGTKDVAGQDAILKEKIVSALKEVFSLYGYSPLETPIIEKLDVLTSKYGGGEEILKETFKLQDQGKRDLGLRYDLTVPMARFIAMNPGLKMPFKRYQIGEVFRDGPIKLGRYRQFTQCDVDIVGIKGMAADAEMIFIAKDAFAKLKLPVVIKVNSRKLLNAIMDYAGIPAEKQEAAILAVDKLDKIGESSVKKELAGKGISAEAARKLFSALKTEGSNSEKLAKVSKLVKNQEGIEDLKELFSIVTSEFEPSLARGLSYYTGTVFEVFLKNSGIKSAVAAGGRYDRMIGQLIESKQDYPAVGISFGVDVIADGLKEKGVSFGETTTRAFVIPIKAFKDAIGVSEKLRNAGINTDMELAGRNVGKALEYANKLQIPFTIFVGEQEVKAGKIKLRIMKSGSEFLTTLEEAIELIKRSL
ncbi:MAG: histidine--tRNA ligase [Candidatus Woesearchaeota archaeon]